MTRSHLTPHNTFTLLFILALATWPYLAGFTPNLQAAPGDTIIYVDQNATGANNGTSWQHAYTDLQDALAAAQSNHSIWIAKGIYRPVTHVTDLDADSEVSFKIPSGVEVYGGFAGTETDLAQRNWEVNKTILSGDLAEDDLTDADGVVVKSDDKKGTNSLHVVSIIDANDTVVLDGLFITGGSIPSLDQDGGAGIFIQNAKTILRHLVFSGHGSNSPGGVLSLINSEAELSDSFLFGNRAFTAGAINNNNSQLTITNVNFSNNSSPWGGAIRNEKNGKLTITDSTFSNHSAMVGGAIYNLATITLIANTSFSNNSAQNYGGAIASHSSSPTITHVSFSDNSAGSGGAIYIENSNSTIINASFSNNSSTIYGGAIRIASGNPTIINASFSGNRSNEGGAIYNHSNSSTIINASFSGNYTSDSGAAIYNYSGSTFLHNSIIWGNSSSPAFNNGGSQTTSYSLVEGCNPGGTWNSACGNNGGGNLADADPLFVDPVDYTNTPTTDGDLRLLPNSPAIDKGNNALMNANVTEDLDGKPRILGPTIDLGAYEIGYQLNTGVIGNGAITHSPSNDWYPPNSTIALTATANAGWSFAGWSGDLNSSSSPTTLLMNNSKVITATFTNDPPTAHAGIDQIVVAGTLVTLDGSGSYDEDPTQTITHAWTQTAGPAVTLSNASAVSPSFTPTIAGVYTFSLEVTDHLGAVSAADTVTITVTNDPPIANAGTDQAVLVATQVTLNGSSSSDPDGHTPLTYGWMQTSGTSVTLTGADTAQPTFTAPSIAGTLTFSLVVTDSLGVVSEPDTVTITVTNGEPVAHAGEDQTVLVGTQVTLDGSNSSDPDGHTPLTYGWTQTSGTLVTLTGADTAQPTFTAPSTADTLIFSLIVTDSMGLVSAADSVTVTVVPYRVHLPLLMRPEPQSNLVVTALQADQNGISVVIRNIGNAPTKEAFWVDVYINPSQPPTVNTPWHQIAPAGAVWGVNRTLAPGESLTLTRSSSFYTPEYSAGTYEAGAVLYAFVDSYGTGGTHGAELEGNEQDNRFGPVIATTAGSTRTPSSAPRGAPVGLPAR